MNFVADESVNRQVVERLRQDGHVVVHFSAIDPGAPDESVIEEANRRQYVLITANSDFGELVFRQELANFGVVLIRLTGLSANAKAGIVSDAVSEAGERLRGAFSVITPGFVRIRRLVE